MPNRKIEIGLGRKNLDGTDLEHEQALFDHKANVAKKIIGHSITRVGIVIFGYIILDTARKVVVNTTSK